MPGDLTATGLPRKRFPHAVRRQKLLDIAEILFAEQGYSGVTMEDIRLKAEVSRPVLYDHFPTREAVYLGCVARARKQYDTALYGSLDRTLPLRQQVRSSAEKFFGLLENDPGRWRLIFDSSGVLSGNAGQELSDLRFQTIELIEDILGSAAPASRAVDIKIAAHAISGAGERLGLLWLAEPKLTKEQLVNGYVDFVWRGLGQLVIPGADTVHSIGEDERSTSAEDPERARHSPE